MSKAAGVAICRIKTLKKGTAYLTLKVGNKSYKNKITVNSKGDPIFKKASGSNNTSVGISSKPITLKPSKTISVKGYLKTGCCFFAGNNEFTSVFWTVSGPDKKVALAAFSDVYKNHTYSYVTCNPSKKGTYTVTATATKQNGKTIVYKAKVNFK